MAVTAEDVVKAYEKAKASSDEAETNTASEDKCVDCLGALAVMRIPVKLFASGALGEVPKAIKRLARKGPTDRVKAAADKCVERWKVLMLGGSVAGAQKDDPKPDEAANTTTAKREEAPEEVAAEANPERAAEGNPNPNLEQKRDAEYADADAADVDADPDEAETEDASLKELLGPALGDPLRDKTRELLAEALASCVGQDGVYASLRDVAATACQVERAMANKWTDCGKEYKAKFRQLSFNLKDPKNPDLRRSVSDGVIDPATLVEMSPEELGSAERRLTNEAIREHATNEAVRGQKKEASTDAFKCGKCKQRKCTYYQLQTRSADEPMTTFVTCVNCDNRWKFC